jgi:hypothetical protein
MHGFAAPRAFADFGTDRHCTKQNAQIEVRSGGFWGRIDLSISSLPLRLRVVPNSHPIQELCFSARFLNSGFAPSPESVMPTDSGGLGYREIWTGV